MCTALSPVNLVQAAAVGWRFIDPEFLNKGESVDVLPVFCNIFMVGNHFKLNINHNRVFLHSLKRVERGTLTTLTKRHLMLYLLNQTTASNPAKFNNNMSKMEFSLVCET